jgi:hypothetical protein
MVLEREKIGKNQKKSKNGQNEQKMAFFEKKNRYF